MIWQIKETLIALVSAKEFWSAIVGAIVGGGLSFSIQMVVLREARRQQEDDRKHIQRVHGNSLLCKLIRINANIHYIHQHISNYLIKAEENNPEGDPWMLVAMMVNIPEDITFSTEEMSLLVELKEGELFNLLMPLDTVHNGLVKAMRSYTQLRKALTDQLSVARLEGKLVRGVLSKDQLGPFAGRILELNTLVESTYKNARCNLEDAKQAVQRVNKVLREKLDLPFEIAFEAQP